MTFFLLSRKEKLGKLRLAQGLQKRLKGRRGGGAGPHVVPKGLAD